MKLRSIFTIVMITCVPFFGIAQDPPPIDDTQSAGTEIGAGVIVPDTGEAAPGDLPPAPVGVPIDGGLSFLLVAGVGYGIKKYREQKRKG